MSTETNGGHPLNKNCEMNYFKETSTVKKNIPTTLKQQIQRAGRNRCQS